MASYPHKEENGKVSKHLAITDCYELGSIVKTLSALAALDEGVVKYDEEIDCEGKVAYIDGFRVENWKSLKTSPFWEVVQRSSNVGIAKVTKRLGTKFYDHLKRLGLGEKTNIEFPGERSGFVNPPHNWSKPSILVMSFGYEIMATVVQLARIFSIIANDGYDVHPTLIKERKAPTVIKRLYKQSSIDQIKDILETIGSARYAIDGYRVMGKTGTARCVVDGKYSNREHVYSFGGIIERDNYKRVIITFIKKPKSPYLWAAQLTGPLFHRIAEKMIIHETIS